jgi:hypothetical protein
MACILQNEIETEQELLETDTDVAISSVSENELPAIHHHKFSWCISAHKLHAASQHLIYTDTHALTLFLIHFSFYSPMSPKGSISNVSNISENEEAMKKENNK